MPEGTEALVAKVERREAPRPTSLGARGWRYQLREARRTSSLGCAACASWRLPPLHPLARFARDWQTSDAIAPREREAMPVIPGRSRPLRKRTRHPEV